MRFANLIGSRSLEIVAAPDHSARPGQAVVEIDYCGIGGSDRSAWMAGEAASPAWFGHEWSGRIVELADAVPYRFIGQRVVAAVGPSCGRCRFCASGVPAHCQRVLEQIVGLDPLAASHGGFATQTVADARRLLPVGEAIDSRDAVLTEPAAVAAHALRRSGLSVGDVAVVIGTGTIGLLTAELARIGGAASVVSVDSSSARRELACDMGADAAFDGVDDSLNAWLSDHTDGLGADIVFICVDAAEAMAGGLGLVRPGGVIVAVGVGNQIENLSVTSLLTREADLRVSLGYKIDDVRRVKTLMEADRLRVRKLLQSTDLTLDQLADALNHENQTSGRPKAVIRP